MTHQTYIGKVIEKPWGYELIWAHTERYVGKILHINKGESLSYQYHRIKDESIRLLGGALELDVEIDGPRQTLKIVMCWKFHPLSSTTLCDLKIATAE